MTHIQVNAKWTFNMFWHSPLHRHRKPLYFSTADYFLLLPLAISAKPVRCSATVFQFTNKRVVICAQRLLKCSGRAPCKVRCGRCHTLFCQQWLILLYINAFFNIFLYNATMNRGLELCLAYLCHTSALICTPPLLKCAYSSSVYKHLSWLFVLCLSPQVDMHQYQGFSSIICIYNLLEMLPHLT